MKIIAYLEVEEDTISPAPGLALTNNNSGHGYMGEINRVKNTISSTGTHSFS